MQLARRRGDDLAGESRNAAPSSSPAEPFPQRLGFRVGGVVPQGLLQVPLGRGLVVPREVDEGEVVVCRGRLGPVPEGLLQVRPGLLQAPRLVVQHPAVQRRGP